MTVLDNGYEYVATEPLTPEQYAELVSLAFKVNNRILLTAVLKYREGSRLLYNANIGGTSRIGTINTLYPKYASIECYAHVCSFVDMADALRIEQVRGE